MTFSHTSKFKIFKTSIVIVVGDMNYRIDDLGYDKVLKCISQNDIQLLLKNDQLNKQRKKKIVFGNFEEGEITFLPSYKFDKDTDIYDTSEKRRVPSFCDRVLYMSKNLEILNYNSFIEYKSSDHKPVSALFNAKLKFDEFKNSFVLSESIEEEEIFVIYKQEDKKEKLEKIKMLNKPNLKEKMTIVEHIQNEIIKYNFEQTIL
jgi:hypothetical protein